MPCLTRPRRTARAGVTLAGLLLSAGFTVPFTAAPALAEAGPAQARTSGSCDSLDEQLSHEGGSTSSYNTPRTGQPISASADANTQTASIYGIADVRGTNGGSDTCRAAASFDNVLHVGAGSTDLEEGDEVTLVATVEFDPLLDEITDIDEKMITSWNFTGGYSVVDPEAPCIPDEESGDYCAEPDPLAEFQTYAQRTTFTQYPNPDNPWADPDGRYYFVQDAEWGLTTNTGQAEGDDVPSVLGTLCETFPCQGDPVNPSRLDPHQLAPAGPQQLEFTTRVGASLEVGGAISLLVQAYDGDVAAFVDATDGLTASIVPAADSAGIELTLGDAPPPPPLDEVAPAVTATPSASPNAAGWHKDPVTVQLDATDAGSGVASITYAVNGGEPVTVTDDSAPVLVDQDGTTTITYSATDAADNTSDLGTTTVKLDRTAPALQLPNGVTAAATGPSGAVVNHTHTATDALSGATSQCTPASGSTFPVGTTTVSCTATDGAGNTATGTFPVTVTAQPTPGTPTPAQRIDALQSAVSALQAPASVKAPLNAKLASSERFVAAGKGKQACTHLAQFVQHVEKNTRKGIAPANAAALTNDARAVRTALGC